MLYTGTVSASRPDKVKLENLQEGKTVVRLADHITEEVVDERPSFTYDEVVFNLPEDREETVETITEGFAAWWEFGQQEEEAEATLEERLAALEDAIMELLGGM